MGKRRRRKVTVSPGDPTPEQLLRNRYGTRKVFDPETRHPREARCSLTASTVDRWRARGLIGEREWAACAKYREDYERGGYDRPITGGYEFGGGGGGGAAPNMTGLMAATIGQHDARLRLRAARAAMPQRLLAGFDDLVVHDLSRFDSDEPGSRLAASLSIERVRICAAELADYYRLPGGCT